MTKQNATNDILERLLAINWKTYPLHTASHKLLLQEHFRRMALWSKALDLTEHWPFFDVAAGVNPSIRATTDQVEILDEHLLKIDVGHYTFLECGWALHWGALKDILDTKYSILPEPYEPILVMYERSGWFHVEHKVLVAVSSVRGFLLGKLSDYDRLLPFVELDKVTLDKIDAEQG